MSERTIGDSIIIWLGVTIVLVGVVLTFAQLLGVRALEIGWPLLVIVPGVAITIAALVAPGGRGLGYLAIPGAMILVTGVVLEVQAIARDWQSWSYAWALIAPGSVGLGFLLAGMRERSRWARITGGVLIASAAVLFLLAEWFFVRVMDVGGPGLGQGFGLVLPALVITLGLVMVVRGLARGR